MWILGKTNLSPSVLKTDTELRAIAALGPWEDIRVGFGGGLGAGVPHASGENAREPPSPPESTEPQEVA
jgi:hypothetical protein